MENLSTITVELALIDTCAEASVMNMSVFDSITPAIEDRKINLQTSNGKYLKVNKQATINFRIGRARIVCDSRFKQKYYSRS